MSLWKLRGRGSYHLAHIFWLDDDDIGAGEPPGPWSGSAATALDLSERRNTPLVRRGAVLSGVPGT